MTGSSMPWLLSFLRLPITSHPPGMGVLAFTAF